MKLIPASFLAFLLFACNSTQPPKEKIMDTKHEMETTLWGSVEGKPVELYTLTNPQGMIVKISNYGGTVTQMLVPDRKGALGDVLLGFDSLSGYLQKDNPYFGCLVGRYANRIKAGAFTLEGKKYQLAKNDNGNTLHGGLKGFDKVVWELEKQMGDSSLVLRYSSPDGEEGYPGKLDITVTYTLTSENALMISYEAITDQATPVNLTNHCYFNLSAGEDSTVLDHELLLHAGNYTPVDDLLIPTGKIDPVSGGPMDFQQAKKIEKDIAQVKGGYDHNWILEKGSGPAASLYHAASGRYMEVFTTEPAIQFYSGNFLDGTLTGKFNRKYVKHAGLCLETQHYPDSPNQPSFPNTILKPGEKYSQVTTYKFSVK